MINRERIARKIAQDIGEGEFVNCGHGIPYSVGQYIDPAKGVIFQNEPGLVCFGVGEPAEKFHYDYYDNALNFVSGLPGGAFFDTASSFAMIRGGHVDRTILGALQVDEDANIANWAMPGKPSGGIGGAMDLCAGCMEVYVAMESTTKDGKPRILKKCTYPLTAANAVTRVYTEFGVMTVRYGEGFTLIEKFPDYSVDEILGKAEPVIRVAEGLKEIDLGVSL